MSTTVLKQSERQFERAVVEYAEHRGWKTAHFNDSRREIVNKRTGERKLVGDKDAKGFPDRVFARRGRIIFAELKAANGRLSDDQRDWLVALGGERDGSLDPREAVIAAVNGPPRVIVRCWRPSDWDEIQAVLR